MAMQLPEAMRELELSEGFGEEDVKKQRSS
jgi:hypothetical protein